jgi:hypothetical protein
VGAWKRLTDRSSSPQPPLRPTQSSIHMPLSSCRRISCCTVGEMRAFNLGYMYIVQLLLVQAYSFLYQALSSKVVATIHV